MHFPWVICEFAIYILYRTATMTEEQNRVVALVTVKCFERNSSCQGVQHANSLLSIILGK